MRANVPKAKAVDKLTDVLGRDLEEGNAGGCSPISFLCSLCLNRLRSATGKPLRDRSAEQSKKCEQKEQCR